MKLVMTLVVRDEEDVLEANLDYHFEQGVDFVLAIDHRSLDRTPDILASYADRGCLRFERREEEVTPRSGGTQAPQGEWLTRLAREAATDLGADWVLHNDADEFWWPASGTLKDVLAGVPGVFGSLAAPKVDFVASAQRSGPFAERMTLRETYAKLTYKVAHRALPDVVVGRGTHRVESPAMRPVPYWPVRIFHFPVRSPEQLGRRARFRHLAPRGAHRTLYEAYQRLGAEQLYDSLVPSQAEIARLLEEGRLTSDDRFRRFFRGERDLGLDAGSERAETHELMLHSLERNRQTYVGRYHRLAHKADRLAQANRELARANRRLEKRLEKVERAQERLVATAASNGSGPGAWIRRLSRPRSKRGSAPRNGR